MDATPDKSFQYGFEGEVGIGQRKTVNTLRLKSVNRLCLGFGRAARFERAAPCTPCRCATWLRYAPTAPRISYPVFCFNFSRPAPVLDSGANRGHNIGAYGALLEPANLDARIICSRSQNPWTPLGGFSWQDRWTA